MTLKNGKKTKGEIIMKKIKIEEINGKLAVTTPFDYNFINFARSVGAKWDRDNSTWNFSTEQEELLNDKLLDIYGYTDKTSEFVIVEIDANDFYDEMTYETKLGDITIATRKHRDEHVILSNIAKVVKGEYDESGGSMKHPKATANSGTIVQVKLDKKAVERFIEQGILTESNIVSVESDKEKLLKEKEELLKRLSEIEKLLNE